MKILVFGEVLWDIYPDKKCIGGAAFNFAAHSALLGSDVSFLSAVGHDALGEQTVKTVEEFGVDTSFLIKSSKKTGSVTVTLDENKIPSYLVHDDTAYDNIEIDPSIMHDIKERNYDCFYFGTLCQRSSVSRNTLKALLNNVPFKNVFCDVNLRKDCYDSDSVIRCLNSATIIKISDEEERVFRSLGGYTPASESNADIAKAICSKYGNIEVVILTLGDKGSFAYERSNDRCYNCPIVPCEVVSTVGAGDSFGAAFLESYFKTRDVALALSAGASLSSFVVSRADAVPKR